MVNSSVFREMRSDCRAVKLVANCCDATHAKPASQCRGEHVPPSGASLRPKRSPWPPNSNFSPAFMSKGARQSGAALAPHSSKGQPRNGPQTIAPMGTPPPPQEAARGRARRWFSRCEALPHSQPRQEVGHGPLRPAGTGPDLERRLSTSADLPSVVERRKKKHGPDSERPPARGLPKQFGGRGSMLVGWWTSSRRVVFDTCRNVGCFHLGVRHSVKRSRRSGGASGLPAPAAVP